MAEDKRVVRIVRFCWIFESLSYAMAFLCYRGMSDASENFFPEEFEYKVLTTGFYLVLLAFLLVGGGFSHLKDIGRNRLTIPKEGGEK